jgi:two-component system OmpR family sensor kinase
MSWSIRARLTAWYGLVTIVVLATSVVAVAVVQSRLGIERLDGELQRLLLTLEGVMRTEFNEGLTTQAAADEASIEVVAPDRTLVLARPDGTPLAMWGQPFPHDWRPDLAQPVVESIVVGSQHLRVASRPIAYGDHRYVAAAIVSLAELESEHAEMLTALVVGVLFALAVAAAGGWVVGHQTLRPLTDLARQATTITERNPTGRLDAPNSGDELGRFATAFNELLDRLAAVLHSQRQFMADASHELRTPVSVVRTTAQVMLARGGRSTDDYRESLAIVAEQSARLARLVDAMFLLSRAEAEGLPLVVEPLYIDDLVAECARALRVFADERGVSVDSSGAAEITFSGDNTLLRQMVGNVLDNAIRHAKPNGHVATTVSSTAGAIEITIVDDGEGVPPDQQERIFQRFVRLDSRSNGAGLGLPIARWIAEAHGGRLTLESSGRGACFRIVLPVR